MKKILTILILLCAVVVSKAQNNGYVSKVTDYIILQGDTIRLDTATLADGQVIKRVGGVWTNDTVSGSASSVESLVWNFSSGYLGWVISGSVADSVSLDDRYVEIADSLTAYVTPKQLSDSIALASKYVYYVEVPASVSVSGRISGATSDLPSWSVSVGTSDVDLKITHNLGRRVHSVTVYSIDGTIEEQLFDAVAYGGVKTLDTNNLLLQSFSQLDKSLKIYILFQ